MSNRATKNSASTFADSATNEKSVALGDLKNCSRAEMPYKVGHLFFEYLAGTYLPTLGYRASDVAEFLEAQKLIETRLVDGQLYYRWIDEKLSKAAFLQAVLPKRSRM